MPARKGFFISFEGGDGAGKSTQMRLLADRLRYDGRTVVVTREPGGSDGAEAIRKLVVEGAAERWSPMVEALLMYAARADHLDRVISPAVAHGDIVITDRFADSTMAYQGIAGSLGKEAVRRIHDVVVAGNDPDITLILDLPVEVGLSRAGKRGSAEARFESKGRDFQARVREAFLEIARDNPARCVVIDASGDETAVAEKIADIVVSRLKAHDA